jgi:hypothetical protein
MSPCPQTFTAMCPRPPPGADRWRRTRRRHRRSRRAAARVRRDRVRSSQKAALVSANPSRKANPQTDRRATSAGVNGLRVVPLLAREAYARRTARADGALAPRCRRRVLRAERRVARCGVRGLGPAAVAQPDRVSAAPIQGVDERYGTMAQLDSIEAAAAGSVTRVELACRHSPPTERPEETITASASFQERLSRPD